MIIRAARLRCRQIIISDVLAAPPQLDPLPSITLHLHHHLPSVTPCYPLHWQTINAAVHFLQNIPIPFTSRPTPLSASTTQGDITSGRMIKSPNTNDLPAEIVISVETYSRVRAPANFRFLKQVTAPTHPAPFTPDQISNLFQSFYSRTFNILPTFLPSPSPSTINLQPLLTATEISDRKRIRGESLVKKQIWEEEIEKRVTTGMYERIFAPKTSDDVERDLKLQGKLKALVVVGVTLEHLGVELTGREKKLLRPSVEAIGRGDFHMNVVDYRATCFGSCQKSKGET